MSRHLGLDLGATNLKWAVVEHREAEPETGGRALAWAVVDRDQVPTLLGAASDPDPAGVPDAVVHRLIDVAREAIHRAGAVRSIGIGVPGLYDPATGVTRFLPNVPGSWAGRPVAAPVADATGLPTFLINDARAFGLAELRLGAGRGASSMVGLTLGTGIGGVIAVDGRVHQGHDGTGGEIGHQTIDPEGPPCTCGNRGCVESFARAERIAAACGTATAEEAVLAAQAGDARAISGLSEAGRYLGIGIANAIVAISPDRVVLGGGMAAAGEVLFEPIRAEVARRVHITSLDAVEIVAAELGTWAGAIGAAVHGAERAGMA